MRHIRQHILCVDDNADIREMLTALLGAAGYDATAVATARDAARLVARDGFDLFILDKEFRTDAGLELCRELRRRHPGTPIIIYSADAYERDHREAARAGATACVDKPQIKPLVSAVKNLIERNAGVSHSTARERVVVGGDAIQDELHGERRHHDAHDARDDVHFAFADARR
jgi:DNA-binding response OmpR family regulator